MGLSRPCSNCPFLRGSDFEVSMVRARAQEIADSLGNGEFPCHKTTPAGGAEKGNEKFCVGAIATMENGGTLMDNQMVRINARLGLIEDPADQDYLDEVYGSLEEWVEVHKDYRS